VKGTYDKTPACYEMSQFSVDYNSEMFHSSGPRSGSLHEQKSEQNFEIGGGQNIKNEFELHLNTKGFDKRLIKTEQKVKNICPAVHFWEETVIERGSSFQRRRNCG